jgi:hypothetical protein
MPFWKKKEEGEHDSTLRPSSPSQTDLWEFVPTADLSQTITWGIECDHLIQNQGRDKFQNECTPEMVKAYNMGLLHVIPLPTTMLAYEQPIPSLSLNLVDTATYWTNRYLVSRGPFKTSQEQKLRVCDFGHKLWGIGFMHPLIKDFLHIKDLPAGQDYALGRNAPRFLVQTYFKDLSYFIFECPSPDMAKQLLDMRFDMQKRFEKTLVASVLLKVFPTLRQEDFEAATKFITINGNQTMVSKWILPKTLLDTYGHEIGGFALDYALAWWYKNAVFFVHQRNVFKYMEYDHEENLKYDDQSLKDALVNFEDVPAYEKGVSLLRLYENNKHVLRCGD